MLRARQMRGDMEVQVWGSFTNTDGWFQRRAAASAALIRSTHVTNTTPSLNLWLMVSGSMSPALASALPSSRCV